MEKLTQEQKILNYWKTNKYINRPIAMNRLNIYNLTAVISSMRAKGYDILDVPQKKGKRYVKYCLNNEA